MVRILFNFNHTQLLGILTWLWYDYYELILFNLFQLDFVNLVVSFQVEKSQFTFSRKE